MLSKTLDIFRKKHIGSDRKLELVCFLVDYEHYQVNKTFIFCGHYQIIKGYPKMNQVYYDYYFNRLTVGDFYDNIYVKLQTIYHRYNKKELEQVVRDLISNQTDIYLYPE